MSLAPATGLVSATQVNGQGGYAVTVQVTDSASPASNVAAATLNFGVNSDAGYGGCQMFPLDSIYNQRIDLLPVDTTPSHQIPPSYLTFPIHPDFGHGFYPIPGGIPFMRVPANQPLTNVNLAFAGQIDANGTYAWPFPAWPNAVIEATSYGLDAIDHHILILQSSINNIVGPQTGPCTLYETYQSTPVPGMFSAATNTWSMLAGVHYVLNSNEIAASNATLDNGAQDSPGIPMVPLLLRYNEVPLGAQHPLRISFPSPTNGWVWPGTGCCGGSGPPQGLLYRLKASVNWQASCPVSVYPQAATVLQALQQYGAYMSDHGGTGFVGGVPDVRWDDNDLACIKKLHVSDLEVVDNSMLEVSALRGQTKPYVVPATLPNGAVGVAYSATFSAVGGNPGSRQWTLSSGALPPGLLLAPSTGTISGAITSGTGSPYTFGITVTDTSSSRASLTQTFSITVPHDSTPPSTPGSVLAVAVSASQINVSWAASTDNVGVTGYRVFRNGVLAGTVTALTDSDTGLAGSTTYSYTVAAFDAAGNVSTPSSAATATTLSSDTTPPNVSITAPAGNTTVSNTITVTAAASDNVAVADVQFQLDGVNVGADLTTAPYSISWNTATSSNGIHSLTAIAHDTAHNAATSAVVQVTVSNTATQPPAAGLIGYWNFDEGSGTIAHDTSTSGYNGALSGPIWTVGKINSGLSFNGTSAVVTPNITLGNTFSVSAWVNPAVTVQGTWARIAETQYSSGFYLGANEYGARYKFIVNGAAGSTGTCLANYGCAEGGTVASGWHLVTATFDGTTARLYVDNAQVASDTFSAPANTNFPLYIGRYYGASAYGWNGAIDEVRLYNRALTPTEVIAIYSH
jgi:chitodextrinase